ncbi:chemotaxis protein [Desulfovibrio sp. JC010]|uniref:chemotaxis protein n=1 Tax=Desulfovibrio sp. JC010 TaxID=2593641 RepID=UPI0013D4213A|nr:chemotaxis protein [Desulfovibrio sp. JC010]NDV28267.1 chemotaxis protein CheV [Desulfovibrio sp. JC010]
MAQTDILLEAGTNELEIVEFWLEEEPREDGEENYRGFYGVNVAKVLEIIRIPEKITKLPKVHHPAIMGTFNLRNKVIPLVDLSHWLKKPRVETEPPKVIVTEFNNVSSAFLVSGVTRIHRISWERVEAPSNYVSTLSEDSITGVVKFEDRISLILDLEKIVAELNPDLGLQLDDSIDWANHAGYKAIIADDSTLIREMLHEMMVRAKFSVEMANTGRACWDKLQEYKRRSIEEKRPISDFVNIVISDIEMPVMDGHNLTVRIKADEVLKQLPVILFSSIITDKLRHKGEAVGADDQISKPEVTQLAQRSIALIEK